jgi:hypothetical protein
VGSHETIVETGTEITDDLLKKIKANALHAYMGTLNSVVLHGVFGIDNQN